MQNIFFIHFSFSKYNFWKYYYLFFIFPQTIHQRIHLSINQSINYTISEIHQPNPPLTKTSTTTPTKNPPIHEPSNPGKTNLSAVSHGEKSCLWMLMLETLIGKCGPSIDRHTTLTIQRSIWIHNKVCNSKNVENIIFFLPVPSPFTKSPPWIIKSLITRWKLDPEQYIT